MNLFNLLAHSNTPYMPGGASSMVESAIARRNAEQAARTQDCCPTSPGRPSVPVDRYEPSAPSQTQNDPGTYQFQRQARLDYSMTLKFDLSVLTSTAAKIADGNVESLQSLMAAGFGLSADLSFTGSQTIQDNGGEYTNEASMMRSMQAGQSRSRTTSISARDLNINTFQQESSRVRRGIMHQLRDGHRVATNNLAMRYRMDTKMDVASLYQFNRQADVLAQTGSPAMESYLDSAGKVASGGSVGMIGQFFDMVEKHLASSEQNISAQAEQMFDTATSELGFSGSLIDAAENRLMGNIEGFFDRVDSTMNRLETHFTDLAAQRSASLANQYNQGAQQRHAGFLATA